MEEYSDIVNLKDYKAIKTLLLVLLLSFMFIVSSPEFYAVTTYIN